MGRETTIWRTATWAALEAFAVAVLFGPDAFAQVAGQRLTLRIGSDSSPNYILTAVGGLAVRSDGAIFVLQPREAVVRAYTEKGTHLFDFGRRGDGPGDFRYMGTAGWGRDTIRISDLIGRVSSFDSKGRFLNSSRIEKPATQLVQLVNGDLLASEGVSADRVARGVQTSIPLLQWNPRNRQGDTIRMLDVANSIWKISNPAVREGPSSFRTQPYDESTLWGTSPDGAWIVIVDRKVTVATQRTFRLTKLSATGDTVFSKNLSYTPTPIDSRFVDSLVDAEARRAVSRQMFSSFDAARREIRRSFHRPPHMPPVAQLIVGRDGSIWLRKPGPARGATWHVISADGGDLGEVEAPERFRLHVAQLGTIWGTEQDEFDVETVVRYEIGPPKRK